MEDYSHFKKAKRETLVIPLVENLIVKDKRGVFVPHCCYSGRYAHICITNLPFLPLETVLSEEFVV